MEAINDNRHKNYRDEMRYIALFESISGASVKDCIIDEEGGNEPYSLLTKAK